MIDDLPSRVDLRRCDRLHDGFIKLDLLHLRHARFDGSMSPELRREIVVRRPAAALLPYDPIADRVVLIQQFRPAVYYGGEQPWLTEVVAGLVDEGEDVETAMRREAIEEAGLRVGRLASIGTFYTSPGACTESVTCFCGEVDSTGAQGHFGSTGENEDIRVFSVPADTYIADALSGRINNATSLICGLWFAAMRAGHKEIWTD
jgi:ADP-ribose pyrophosphatase